MPLHITARCDYHEPGPENHGHQPTLLVCDSAFALHFDDEQETLVDLLKVLIRESWDLQVHPDTGVPARLVCPFHTPNNTKEILRIVPIVPTQTDHPSGVQVPKQPPRLHLKGQRPDPPNIKLELGDFVGVVKSGGTWGRVFEIKHDFDHHGHLYKVRLYDIETGLPMICPDSRCNFSDMRPVGTATGTIPMAQAWPPRGHGCVICCYNGGRKTFSKWSPHDVGHFRKEGWIKGD